MTIRKPTRRSILTVLAVAALSIVLNVVFGAFRLVRTDGEGAWPDAETVTLPPPTGDREIAVADAIGDRRSRREYGDEPLSRQELGQLLWATQGVTDRRTGFRSAPSAGALYPLEVYVVVGEDGVDGLESGVYHYRPERQELPRGHS